MCVSGVRARAGEVRSAVQPAGLLTPPGFCHGPRPQPSTRSSGAPAPAPPAAPPQPGMGATPKRDRRCVHMRETTRSPACTSHKYWSPAEGRSNCTSPAPGVWCCACRSCGGCGGRGGGATCSPCSDVCRACACKATTCCGSAGDCNLMGQAACRRPQPARSPALAGCQDMPHCPTCAAPGPWRSAAAWKAHRSALRGRAGLAGAAGPPLGALPRARGPLGTRC